MFDFYRWREWLRGRAVDLETDGFRVTFNTNDRYLPSTALAIETNSLIGVFSNWECALVDYDFLDIPTDQATSEPMIPVDDSNFEAVFIVFVKRFRQMD